MSAISERLSYESWYAACDAAVESLVGLAADDLPDWDWYKAYANRMQPTRAARLAIAAAGGF